MSRVPFDASDFTLGDVNFSVKKMLPIPAKNIFMSHVRPLLRGALSANADKAEDFWQVILAAITDAPKLHYDALVKAMYYDITYTSPNAEAPVRLLGDEENAFKDLDMAHLLILDGRAFCVNFFQSFNVLQSEFPLVGKIIKLWSVKTQTPSSTTQSERISAP